MMQPDSPRNDPGGEVQDIRVRNPREPRNPGSLGLIRPDLGGDWSRVRPDGSHEAGRLVLELRACTTDKGDAHERVQVIRSRIEHLEHRAATSLDGLTRSVAHADLEIARHQARDQERDLTRISDRWHGLTKRLTAVVTRHDQIVVSLTVGYEIATSGIGATLTTRRVQELVDESIRLVGPRRPGDDAPKPRAQPYRDPLAESLRRPAIQHSVPVHPEPVRERPLSR